MYVNAQVKNITLIRQDTWPNDVEHNLADASFVIWYLTFSSSPRTST